MRTASRRNIGIQQTTQTKQRRGCNFYVRFRFHLTNGDLYAFWVSPDASGASYGFMAAGGPGFLQGIDDVGASPP